MSAYRQAMLAVPPERLEQFSLEMQQNIDKNDKKKRRSSSNSKSHKRHKSKKDSPEERKSKQKSHKGSKKVTSKKKPGEKSRSKKSSTKSSKEKRKRRKSEEEGRLTGDSDVEENGLNLDKELHSLSFYVKDRKHLIEQVFQIVKGPKLGAMLPDILKNIPLDELKRKCCEQLEVMSSKRIHHVLAGKAMESSSGTDSSEDENSEAIPKLNPAKVAYKEQPTVQANFVDSTTTSGCEVLSLLADNSKQKSQQEEASASTSPDKSEDGSEEGEVSSEEEEEEEEITLVEEEEVDSSEVEEIETVEVVEDEEYHEMVDGILEQTMPGTSGEPVEDEQSQKTQLELLELQLRERAIKSLMRAAGKLEEDEK